jgi:hypothetical protein
MQERVQDSARSGHATFWGSSQRGSYRCDAKVRRHGIILRPKNGALTISGANATGGAGMGRATSRLNQWVGKWAGAALASCAAFFVGMLIGVSMTGTPVDSGIATLVGSFVGALAAVLAAIYGAERAYEIKRRTYTGLLADTLEPLRRKFSEIIDRLSSIDIGAVNPKAEGEVLLRLIGEAEDAKAVLIELTSASELPDFASRLHIFRITKQLEELQVIFNRERGFLSMASRPVIENSIRNMTHGLVPIIDELKRAIAYIRTL